MDTLPYSQDDTDNLSKPYNKSCSAHSEVVIRKKIRFF